MKYTVDTEAKTLTIQSDATFDELRELGEKFAGFTVKMQAVSVSIAEPDYVRTTPVNPYRWPYGLQPWYPWYPNVAPNQPYWWYDPQCGHIQ